MRIVFCRVVALALLTLLLGCPGQYMTERLIGEYYVIQNNQDTPLTLKAYETAVDTVLTVVIGPRSREPLYADGYSILAPRGGTATDSSQASSDYPLQDKDLDSLFLLSAAGDTLSQWRSGDVVPVPNTAVVSPDWKWDVPLIDTYLGDESAYIMRF